MTNTRTQYRRWGGCLIFFNRSKNINDLTGKVTWQKRYCFLFHPSNYGGNQNNFISVSASSDKFECPDYGIFSLMAHVECHL